MSSPPVLIQTLPPPSAAPQPDLSGVEGCSLIDGLAPPGHSPPGSWVGQGWQQLVGGPLEGFFFIGEEQPLGAALRHKEPANAKFWAGNGFGNQNF